MNILDCHDLTKIYPGQTTALDHINLSCADGKIIGLLGPNGSGKTTLIKLIQGLLTPTEGEVLIDGKKPGPETKAMVSYLPDLMSFDESMKIRDLFWLYQDFYTDFDKSRAEDMIQKLQLDPSEKIKLLSKGNKEKVQLILCMARNARLYLLDEPIGGVDPATRDFILHTILSNYQRDKASILISTHLIADVENILDEAIIIQKGHIQLHESVETIREQYGCSVNEYFKEAFKCY
ncbi:MAG: ABC transporter ATP-binding protein [Catenisphaera adipataccumulans]|jgi:ABC-2 type transport system ATP-binding protein|uniref:ABC transporter ATP-binding protein n=1 Tax=Catenisphaera adipataccumulans TaxID=700500 RepID=UPI003D932AA6